MLIQELPSSHPAHKFSQLLRSSSLQRMQQHSSNNSLQIKELDNPNDLVFGHWMAMILISGEAVKITFQTHYQTSCAQKLLGNLMQKKPSEIGLAQAADYIREYCNLTAGHIKNTLEQANLPVGITLPLVSRGFDNIFFSVDQSGKKIKDRWAIQGDDVKIICTIQIEVRNEQKMTDVNFETAAAADEGEIEFL